METEKRLEEDVIDAWVRLTGLLKNTRLTQGMNYNEAVIMLLVYRRYTEDSVGLVSFREIVDETRMLKSLVNRTIDSLVRKGFLARCEGTSDRRTTYVRPVKESLPAYLEVHAHTLDMVHELVGIIGEEDARAFVRIAGKISSAPKH